MEALFALCMVILAVVFAFGGPQLVRDWLNLKDELKYRKREREREHRS